MADISMGIRAVNQLGSQEAMWLSRGQVSFSGGTAIWLALHRRISAPGLHHKECARSLQSSAPLCHSWGYAEELERAKRWTSEGYQPLSNLFCSFGRGLSFIWHWISFSFLLSFLCISVWVVHAHICTDAHACVCTEAVGGQCALSYHFHISSLNRGLNPELVFFLLGW